MKVMFITNYPSPYRVDFFNELGKQCELTVLFDEDIKMQKQREEEWFDKTFTTFNAIFLSPKKIFRDLMICFDVRKYLNDNYDLIVVCNYSSLTGMYAINYLKKKKIKFAIEADGGLIKSGKGLKEKLKRKLISSANWWFSSGNMTDEYFLFYDAKPKNIIRYPFTSLRSVDILQNAVDENVKKDLKHTLGISEEKVLLSVGQFIHRKGFDVLLKACKNIPKEHGVYIVGGIPTPDYLKIIEELNLTNVHFIGFKSKDDIKDYYLASDLFVLPTREDIWGLVINEAMAKGLPVITTDKCVAGIELINNDENGYIVPVNDEKLLAIKINEILSNDLLKKEMSEKNIKKISPYTIENMAKKHIEIFRNLR